MLIHRRPPARTEATLGLVIALAIVFFVACNDDGGPTSSTNPPAATIATTASSPPPTTATDPAPSPACQIDISRSKSLQSISAAGSTVTGTVYASERSGKPLYVRIWYNERHETKVGDFEVNEPFSFELPSPGEYRLVIDVEYDGDGDGNADCQRDGLNKTVTVKTPPPEGCSVRLRCEEQRSGEEISVGEGLTKHLSCNVPGTWSHDADEAETSSSSFWGYWQSQANPRTANATFTANADRRCTESWEWPVPVDPCVPPNEQSFKRRKPIGNPRAECSFFGEYVPTDQNDADFYVTKCGLFYEVTHDPFVGGQCSNGKDVSHTTACVCGDEDED